VIQHDIFAEKVKAALVRAGLPIAGTLDASLTAGAFLEIEDDEALPPTGFLEWRVHPSVHEHFRGVSHAELLSDPQVQAMRTARQAMNAAVAAILESAGFQVREAVGERAGELVVGPQE